jgi:ubiquinone/menaquinone biosynthesis C-methylase UbiE
MWACGIGGPSRYLAKTYGCRVAGLDLTPEFCQVAAMLAERTGLAGKVEYREGDALAMPFADRSFDVVWSQNVAMNIADRDRLYREIRRVLRPDGRYAFSDVVDKRGWRTPLSGSMGARFLDQLSSHRSSHTRKA